MHHLIHICLLAAGWVYFVTGLTYVLQQPQTAELAKSKGKYRKQELSLTPPILFLQINNQDDWSKRSIFQTFWKPECCAFFLFFELETLNFGYLLMF